MLADEHHLPAQLTGRIIRNNDAEKGRVADLPLFYVPTH